MSGWTLAEVRTLREMVSEGKGGSEIADAVGHSTSAVQQMCRSLSLSLRRNKRDDEELEPNFEKDARVGSQTLLQACFDLFARTANDRRVSLNDAMCLHLGTHGRPTLPGCERAIRGQFAARKLAA